MRSQNGWNLTIISQSLATSFSFAVIQEYAVRVSPNAKCSKQMRRRRLVWSWVNVPKDESRPRPAPMTITWTLTPQDDGTLLILEHTGAENIDWLTRNMMRIGWGYMMKKMISRVLQHAENGVFRPGAIPLEKRYYTCKTVPDEYIR